MEELAAIILRSAGLLGILIDIEHLLPEIDALYRTIRLLHRSRDISIGMFALAWLVFVLCMAAAATKFPRRGEDRGSRDR